MHNRGVVKAVVLLVNSMQLTASGAVVRVTSVKLSMAHGGMNEFAEGVEL